MLIFGTVSVLPASTQRSCSVRLAAEDRRIKAWCDYEAGYWAKDALKAFLSRGPVMIARMGPDKYGRTLARVTVNGEDAGANLVGLGLARRWR